MDIIVDAVLEAAGEIVSGAIDAAVVSHKEKKRQREQEEERNGSEELDH